MVQCPAYMPQPLIAAGKLIDHSWKMMLTHWRATLIYTVPLFLLPFILTLLATPLILAAALTGKMAYVGIGSFLYMLAVLALVSWPTLKLMRFLLEKDLGRALPSPDKDVTFPLILSYLWIVFLVCLAVGLGYVAFIIPGIWLAGLLAFSYLYLLEDGLKGTEALKASAKLVKGRWWAVFGRLFLAGLFIVALLIGLSIAIGIASSILGAVLGNGLIGKIVLTAINVGLQLVITVLVTVYSLSATIKLFHALKETHG